MEKFISINRQAARSYRRTGEQRGDAGKTAEVAEAILWLASEKSSYTPGSFIELSGGK